uniref:Putative secreted protein n=1 Tax=Anopheles darlingi TaxID=43151 RepID=A0A2M4DH09_ANODA
MPTPTKPSSIPAMLPRMLMLRLARVALGFSVCCCCYQSGSSHHPCLTKPAPRTNLAHSSARVASVSMLNIHFYGSTVHSGTHCNQVSAYVRSTTIATTPPALATPSITH